ncbi:hypothetical protein OIU79_012905 [Salix purpurea]|uniref:Uncharacterized protein n=1 Tax=Salix purpurea TaxID=77065 RepID=A0A9Q0Q4D2_SALPP|nr:hypothetical protein OIU79_012905 [Salix purpurea]
MLISTFISRGNNRRCKYTLPVTALMFFVFFNLRFPTNFLYRHFSIPITKEEEITEITG